MLLPLLPPPPAFTKTNNLLISPLLKVNLLLTNMSTALPVNGNHERNAPSTDFTVKTGLARMLKGGVIMDVVNAEQVWLNA